MTENTKSAVSMREILHQVLRPHDKVLLCHTPALELLAKEAVAVSADVGASVVHWDTQRNWQGLLRRIFSQWITVLIGDPRIILGIAKVARATGTPLPVRKVVLLGQSCEPWLLKGIRDSLDAKIYTCGFPGMEDPEDPLLRQLDEMLLSWSSVLDYRARRTEQGLCLKIIVFPGHPLPRLPSGANVTVRSWVPKTDAPFCLCEG